MSTSIPYDPSLVLGNIVVQSHLDNLEAISNEQTPVDSDQLALNSALLLKHKLMMTMQELSNLGIDTATVDKALKDVDKAVEDTATTYATTAAASLPKVAELHAKIAQVTHSIESPIDYNKSNIKRMPLAADSTDHGCSVFLLR